MTSINEDFSIIDSGDTMVLMDIFDSTKRNKPIVSDILMVDLTKKLLFSKSSNCVQKSSIKITSLEKRTSLIVILKIGGI